MKNAEVRSARTRLRSARSRGDLEGLARGQSMRPRAGPRRCLNENLAPLIRFLRSREGRRWDDVYGEIRARLSPRSVIDMHIMQHLFDFVHLRVEILDGVVYTRDNRGRCGPLKDYGGGRTFYVHPQTGRLHALRGRRQRRRCAVERAPHRVIGEDHLYLLVREQWYEVWTAPPTRARCFDAVLKAAAGEENASARQRLYGSRGLIAVRKRQLSRAELRRAGLR